MPHRQPFPDWKWPLTHNERIAELEEILRDDHHEPSWENIRAAIEFHRKFDGEAICDAHPQVRFQNGQQLKDGEWPTLQSGQWQLKYWVEVIPRAPIFFLMLKIYQGAIRQCTLNPAPHTQAMASPLCAYSFQCSDSRTWGWYHRSRIMDFIPLQCINTHARGKCSHRCHIFPYP